MWNVTYRFTNASFLGRWGAEFVYVDIVLLGIVPLSSDIFINLYILFVGGKV